MITKERIEELKGAIVKEAVRALNEENFDECGRAEGYVELGDIEYKLRIADMVWDEDKDGHPKNTYYEIKCECNSELASFDIGDIYLYIYIYIHIKIENGEVTILERDEVKTMFGF